MKILRYIDEAGHPNYGVLRQDKSIYRLEGNPYDRLTETQEQASVAKLLAPVQPATILCIGLNYHQHARETGLKVPEYPVLFMKGPNAVQNPNDPILIPKHLESQQVDYECELAVVISRTCKNVSRDDALEYVLGYTCANDVSARDWQIQKGGSQWCRGKTFDTFAPLGPHIVTTEEIPNPNNLKIRTLLNNEIVQDWNTEDMIFDVPDLISFLSGSTTLLPGTVIMTGTPHGVGMAQTPPRWLRPGDTVSIEIEKIGTLTNPVKME